nr:TPA_asm: E8^E2 [Manis javanica papillomavirus 1]
MKLKILLKNYSDPQASSGRLGGQRESKRKREGEGEEEAEQGAPRKKLPLTQPSSNRASAPAQRTQNRASAPAQRTQSGEGRSRRSAAGTASEGGASTSSSPPSVYTTALRRRGGRQRRGPSATALHQPTPPSPEDVGRLSKTLERRSRTRLGRLLEEARDPPIIIVKGGLNPLKCYRYRLNKDHKGTFAAITTGFRWVYPYEKEDHNSGRVIVSFTDKQQRDAFLDTVPMPKAFAFAFGSLESL